MKEKKEKVVSKNDLITENIKKITTPAVFFILKEWNSLLREMRSYSDQKIIKLLQKQHFTSVDSLTSRKFYERFSKDKEDGLYIKNDTDYMKFYGSVMLFHPLQDIEFGFPFQCRQWPKSTLLQRLVERIDRSETKVTVPVFLEIWTEERNKEIIPLTDVDLKILTALTNHPVYSNLQLMNSSNIAEQFNLATTYVTQRMLYLIYTGVLRRTYILNPAKIGFITVLCLDMDNNGTAFSDYLLANIFSGNHSFRIYQLPEEWVDELPQHEQLRACEFGFSIACLNSDGLINHQITRRLFDRLPLRSRYTSKVINLEVERILLTEKELELLFHFSS
jgi:hypothetical protein